MCFINAGDIGACFHFGARRFHLLHIGGIAIGNTIGDVGDFVATIIQAIVGQADRVAAACRRGDGDAIAIGDRFIACGIGGSNLGKFNLVFGCNRHFSAILNNVDIFARIKGHGIAGVNQLVARAAYRTAGCAGGQGKTGIVDGIGNLTGGHQFARVCCRRCVHFARSGGERGGIGLYFAICVFGNGRTISIHGQVINRRACCRILFAAINRYRFVRRLHFGFCRCNIGIELADFIVQLPAIDGVLAARSNISVGNIGNFFVCRINAGFSNARPTSNF